MSIKQKKAEQALYEQIFYQEVVSFVLEAAVNEGYSSLLSADESHRALLYLARQIDQGIIPALAAPSIIILLNLIRTRWRIPIRLEVECIGVRDITRKWLLSLHVFDICDLAAELVVYACSADAIVDYLNAIPLQVSDDGTTIFRPTAKNGAPKHPRGKFGT